MTDRGLSDTGGGGRDVMEVRLEMNEVMRVVAGVPCAVGAATFDDDDDGSAEADDDTLLEDRLRNGLMAENSPPALDGRDGTAAAVVASSRMLSCDVFRERTLGACEDLPRCCRRGCS